MAVLPFIVQEGRYAGECQRQCDRCGLNTFDLDRGPMTIVSIGDNDLPDPELCDKCSADLLTFLGYDGRGRRVPH
jgi:hypothetical protein